MKITKEGLKKVILEAYKTQMVHTHVTDLKDAARNKSSKLIKRIR